MLEEKMAKINLFIATANLYAKNNDIEIDSILVTQSYFADKLNESEFILVGKSPMDFDKKLDFELELGCKFLPTTVKYMTYSEYSNSGLGSICTTVWHS